LLTLFTDNNRYAALTKRLDDFVALTNPAEPTSTSSVPIATVASPYAGTYTDPINHPGGTRRISVESDGKRILCQGGGGRGEPANYELSGFVNDSGDVFVDFTPKGGPKDFRGHLDVARSCIVWTGPGDKELNFWPKTS